jgi:hypothetical protein
MEDFQYKAYTDVLKNEENDNNNIKYRKITDSVKDLPNNFFIGTRIMSNVVFPNRKIGDDGFRSFKGKRIEDNKV